MATPDSQAQAELITVYHGSTETLAFIAKGECVSGSPDYPQRFALGKIPGSKGYGRPAGWIYELRVSKAQITQTGPDTILNDDVIPSRRFPPSEFKPKSAAELLYGTPS
jgi:hypothetical protein